MKKRFFVPACVLAAVAVALAVCAAEGLKQPLPWSARTTRVLCGLTADAALVLLVLALCHQMTRLNILTLLFEMGAVFFLVQSLLTVLPKGELGGDLPLALSMNCIALLLNAIQRRKNRENGVQEEASGARGDGHIARHIESETENQI